LNWEKNFKHLKILEMNKTVTINISGIIFHIEEDAYDSLSKYLVTIKGYFSNTDGGNEIMSDIEARIAELLQAKINVSKQVILMSDVEHVMGVMGKPEDFGGEQAKEKQSEEEEYDNLRTEKIKRRLFRNPDEKAIGGVCSGLAAYFDIDIVWVRLAMFLLIFFGGVSLWVYIILWLVIPEAKTTADKLAMRGETANINSIFRSFKEEAEDVKNRMNKEAKDVKNRMNKYGQEFKNQNYGETVRSNIGSVLNAIFNILGRLIGLFLILIGGILLFAYIMSLMGISIIDSNNEASHWRHVIFESPSHYALGIFVFIIVIGIPVCMMIYGGVKLLFRIHYSNRWLNLSLGIIWTIGLLIGLYVTVVTVKQFNQSSKLKETFVLHGIGDTLVIKLNPASVNLKAMKFDNGDEVENYLSKNHGGYFFGSNDKKLSLLGYADLTVTENNSDSIEMIVTRSAHGYSKKEANENAKAIAYSYHQNNNELIFDEIFSVAEGNKFRAQELEIKIKLPKGKVVYFDKSVKYLLDDVDNTSNTWDGDMVARRWKMTARGLECIDCENLERFDHDRLYEEHRRGSMEEERKMKKRIKIDEHGIRVNGDDAAIKIDEDGIDIKTRDQDIELKNDPKKKEDE
jgi:phage shock protein PspC (stress-responsive transcriptional regulator)